MKLKVFLAISFLIITTTSFSHAQSTENLNYQDGAIESLSKATIQLKYEEGEGFDESDFTFDLAPDLKLENFASINDLKISDEVIIGYTIVNKGMIAKTLFLDKTQGLQKSDPIIKENE